LIIGHGYTAFRPIALLVQYTQCTETFFLPMNHDITASTDTSRFGSGFIGSIGVAYVNRAIEFRFFIFIIECIAANRGTLVALLLLMSNRITTERNVIRLNHLIITS